MSEDPAPARPAAAAWQKGAVSAGADPGLTNADLAPVPPEARTWGTYHMASLWVGLSVCVPTYMLAAGMVEGGMSWWQALVTILLGNALVLLPLVLIAHAGTRYGIPFPVLARSAFGTVGAHVPALLRGLVACGWFGIQTWIGGAAIDSMLTAAWSGWERVPAGEWIAFGAFWAANVWVVVRGSEAIRRLEAWAAPFLLLAGFALLAWAVARSGGLGPILAQPSGFATRAEFWAFFVPALTANVGFWATLALNIPDLSRFAKSQRAQVVGQAVGLPATMTLFAFTGVAVTSASVLVFGEAIWDPVELVSRLGSPAVVLVSLLALAVATLTTNVAANVVAPANAFANLAPRHVDFARGGILTALLGVAILPWRLLSDYGTYIFGWLIGYSGLLGPVAGILIADYWLLRRTRLDVGDLYRHAGRYGRVNGRAMAALAAGIATALSGLAVPALRPLYDYSWFVGFAVAFGLHLLLGRGKMAVSETPGPLLRQLPDRSPGSLPERHRRRGAP